MNANSKLTDAVASATGQTKAEAAKNIEVVLTLIKNLSKENGKVTIQGYGTFAVVQRAARTARNPRTGESIAVPAKEAFTFKASK